MKLRNPIAAVFAAAVTLIACTEVTAPTPDAAVTPAAVRADVQSTSGSGFGMGSGSFITDGDEVTSEVTPADTTGRGGFGMGSGS